MRRLLLLAPLALYLATPVPVYNFNELRVALLARQGGLPFNVYHPLSTWLQAMLMRASPGHELGAWTAVNAFLSVACLVLAWREWRDAGGSESVATGLTACLAVTLPFWFYATTPETYPLAMLGVLWFFRSARGATVDEGGRGALVTGIVATLAVGLNASCVALVAAFLAAPVGWRRRGALLGAFVISVALGIVVMRVVAGPALSVDAVGAGLRSVTGRGEHPLVVVGRAPYLVAGAREPVGDVFHIERLQQWRATLLEGPSAAIVATTLVLAVVLVTLTVAALRRRRDPMMRVHGAALAAWLLLFMLGDPRNGFLYVILIPLGALLAPLLADAPRRLALGALAAGCAGLLTANLSLAVLPNRDPEANDMLRRATSLRSVVRPRDVVVARSTLTCLYDACLVPGHTCWLDGSDASMESARGAVQAALEAGGTAWVEPEVFEFSEGWQGRSERVLDMLDGLEGRVRAADALVEVMRPGPTTGLTSPLSPASDEPVPPDHPGSAQAPRITRIAPRGGAWLPMPQRLPVSLAIAPPTGMASNGSAADGSGSPRPAAVRVAVSRSGAVPALAVTPPLTLQKLPTLPGTDERLVDVPAVTLEPFGEAGEALVVRVWAVGGDGRSTASAESRNPLGGRVAWRQSRLPALSDGVDALSVEPGGTLAAGASIAPRVRFGYSVRSVPWAFVDVELRDPEPSRGAWHVAAVAMPRGMGIADVRLAPVRVPASLAGRTFPVVLALRVDPLGGSIAAPIVAEYRVSE